MRSISLVLAILHLFFGFDLTVELSFDRIPVLSALLSFFSVTLSKLSLVLVAFLSFSRVPSIFGISHSFYKHINQKSMYRQP